MSYELIKLSEVEKVNSSYNANLLIEEGGQIKRLSAENLTNAQPQVQADWNETDDTSPSYIANKPESMGSEVITYNLVSGGLYSNGVAVTFRNVADAWERGAQIRIRTTEDSNGSYTDNTVISFEQNLYSGMGVLLYRGMWDSEHTKIHVY